MFIGNKQAQPSKRWRQSEHSKSLLMHMLPKSNTTMLTMGVLRTICGWLTLLTEVRLSHSAASTLTSKMVSLRNGLGIFRKPQEPFFWMLRVDGQKQSLHAYGHMHFDMQIMHMHKHPAERNIMEDEHLTKSLLTQQYDQTLRTSIPSAAPSTFWETTLPLAKPYQSGCPVLDLVYTSVSLPNHARNVALVLNPTTGLVSPQYHVQFDDLYETTRNPRNNATDLATWQVKAGFKEQRIAMSSMPNQSTTLPRHGLQHLVGKTYPHCRTADDETSPFPRE